MKTFDYKNLIFMIISWVGIFLFYFFINAVVFYIFGLFVKDITMKYIYIFTVIVDIIFVPIILVLRRKEIKTFASLPCVQISYIFKIIFILLAIDSLFFIYINANYISSSFNFLCNIFNEIGKNNFLDYKYINDPFYIYDFIALCFIAPICEEIIFRGLMYNDIKKIFGVRATIFITSFIFCLLHFNDGMVDGEKLIIIRAASTFIFSVFVSYYYEKTKSLITPVLLHIFHNLFAFNADAVKINYRIIVFFIFIIIGLVIITIEGIKYIKNKNTNGVIEEI